MSTPNEYDTAEWFFPGVSIRASRPQPFTSLVRVDLAGLSHTGKVRQNNEDHFLVARFGRFLESLSTNLPQAVMPQRSEEIGYAMVVADGIGGNAKGEVASELAIRTLVNLALNTPDWILMLEDEALFKEIERRAIERWSDVNQMMAEQVQEDPSLEGYGTTMTYGFSLGKDLFLAHMGDSRAYLLRQERLHQLTRDHTMAQAMADQQIISQREIATHRWRHVLTKALGSRSGVEPDVQWLMLEDGDRLLLCTDGLTDMLPDSRIAETLLASETAAKACDRLIEDALEAGGKDNVTAIVARYAIPAVT
jgi:protein phosphatase